MKPGDTAHPEAANAQHNIPPGSSNTQHEDFNNDEDENSDGSATRNLNDSETGAELSLNIESEHQSVDRNQQGGNKHPMTTRAKAGIFKPKIYLGESIEPSEPKSGTEAILNKDWKKAMEEEFNALMKAKTWKLVPSSPSYNIVGNKWVFRVKRNAYGSFQRLKARLVAKGFHQAPGIDFCETFSPVIKASTLRIILTLAVSKGWTIRQIDINNAFLNGELEEVVYMNQSEGFIDKTKPDHVCKLENALYGLKQAPRAWHEKLKTTLMSWKFRQSAADTFLFFFKNER